MLADTTTPDGYTINESGAWTVDGVVQFVECTPAENAEDVEKQSSLREQLEAAQDRLYEVQYANQEKKIEALYEYLALLDIDPTGLEIEEGQIRYFSFVETRSSRFFKSENVLISILNYVGERKPEIDTVFTSEGNYSFTAYLLVTTRRAASELNKAGWK